MEEKRDGIMDYIEITTGTIRKSFECNDKRNCFHCKLRTTKIEKYNMTACEILKKIRIYHYPNFRIANNYKTNEDRINNLISFCGGQCNVSKLCRNCTLKKNTLKIGFGEESLCDLLFDIGEELKNTTKESIEIINKREKISKLALEVEQVQAQMEALTKRKKELDDKLNDEFSNGELLRCKIKFDTNIRDKKNGIAQINFDDSSYLAELIVERRKNSIISCLIVDGIEYRGIARCCKDDSFNLVKGFNISFTRAKIEYNKAMLDKLIF